MRQERGVARLTRRLRVPARMLQCNPPQSVGSTQERKVSETRTTGEATGRGDRKVSFEPLAHFLARLVDDGVPREGALSPMRAWSSSSSSSSSPPRPCLHQPSYRPVRVHHLFAHASFQPAAGGVGAAGREGEDEEGVGRWTFKWYLSEASSTCSRRTSAPSGMLSSLVLASSANPCTGATGHDD